ncbi:trypsin-like peptidase domain-containing protein, partial [Phenylobacterium sp.]|uniref:trypsin-like peptidase domain-containing protein n=1 Tax=Phenylobacterium sp. TaxID=1871053 RepID=UPI002F3F75AF
MRDYRYFMKAGAAVAALGLAGAGGYVARAGVGADGAVNARPFSAPSAGAPASFADIIQHVAPAVVSIEVEGKAGPQRVSQSGPGADEDGGDGLPPELRRFFQQQAPQAQQSVPMRGAGSGFFISPDGYIVTNNHVVENADKITIHMSDDRTLKARLVGRDQATDIAVIKVETTGAPFVSFEDRAKPRVGDWVVAVGNPFNLGGTATAGIISALGRHNVSGSSYVDFMQIDAPINRGNSGGPTFDLYGRV